MKITDFYFDEQDSLHAEFFALKDNVVSFEDELQVKLKSSEPTTGTNPLCLSIHKSKAEGSGATSGSWTGSELNSSENFTNFISEPVLPAEEVISEPVLSVEDSDSEPVLSSDSILQALGLVLN